MQETRINKVSRRYYIDHADDHAVVRTVPVSISAKSTSQANNPPQTEPAQVADHAHKRRVSKFIPSAVRRSRPIRRRA